MGQLYNISGDVVRLYTDFLWGLCFSQYAGRLCSRRFRFSTAGTTVICAAMRALLSFVLPVTADSSSTAVRVLIMLALSAAVLWLFYTPPRRMGIYTVLSWTAVFELSFFIAYSVVLAADPLYDVLRSAQTADPQQYAAASELLASAAQILTAALLTVLCILTVRLISGAFSEDPRELNGTELRLLSLPAVIGILLAVLLRMLIISVTDGIPELLFDLYPPLRLLIPVIAAIALLSIVQAAKTCRDLEQLEEAQRAGLAAKERARALREQVAETERVNAHFRKMRHDLRNTLTIIRQLSAALPESEDLTAYLDKLGQDAAELDRPFSTGDAVADVLLAAKHRELAQKAPDAHLDVSGFVLPQECGISGYDLGIILGNALDNAIQAVAAQKTGQQFIRLSTVLHGDLLSIQIENSCSAAVPSGRDGLPTRSAKNGHGIGMKSIRDVAHRYDGTMDWKAQNCVFTLAVMLRSEKQSVLPAGEQRGRTAKRTVNGT